MLQVSGRELGKIIGTALYAKGEVKAYQSDLDEISEIFKRILEYNNVKRIETPQGVVFIDEATGKVDFSKT